MTYGPRSNCTLAVFWHTRTGASEKLALAVAQGAGEDTLLRHCSEATCSDFVAAKGYVFVCPENLGTMSGSMKEMFDRLYYPLLGQIEGRAFASVIAAGSDGAGAQRQLDRIVKGWRLKRVTAEMIVNFQAQTPEQILAPKTITTEMVKRCRELGAGITEGLRTGIF